MKVLSDITILSIISWCLMHGRVICLWMCPKSLQIIYSIMLFSFLLQVICLVRLTKSRYLNNNNNHFYVQTIINSQWKETARITLFVFHLLSIGLFSTKYHFFNRSCIFLRYYCYCRLLLRSMKHAFYVLGVCVYCVDMNVCRHVKSWQTVWK